MAKVRNFRIRVNQWTRTQRIRTAAAIPVAAPIVDAGSTPVYLEIAAKAAHLRELGLSDRAIARAIGVTDKTVAKSLLRRHAHTSLDRADAVGVDEPLAAATGLLPRAKSATGAHGDERLERVPAGTLLLLLG